MTKEAYEAGDTVRRKRGYWTAAGWRHDGKELVVEKVDWTRDDVYLVGVTGPQNIWSAKLFELVRKKDQPPPPPASEKKFLDVRCGGCFYFNSERQFCMRYPPQLDREGEDYVFPRVSDGQIGCGEFFPADKAS